MAKLILDSYASGTAAGRIVPASFVVKESEAQVSRRSTFGTARVQSFVCVFFERIAICV